MMIRQPELICEQNLSHAWGRVFLKLMKGGRADTVPFLVSVTGFHKNIPLQDEALREALDEALDQHGKFSCDVSASLIFPYKQWLRTGQISCAEISEWYLRDFLPRLKARDRRNQNGTYFERMVAFQGVKPIKGRPKLLATNQIQKVIDVWKRDAKKGRRPRQSALQVACFDPAKDHTGQPVRGFPCLQQVSFTYDDYKGLSVNAFYPTQYIFDRAYGNYLGLCHLGHFMAHELGLKLVGLNCFIACPELGNISKSRLAPLETLVAKSLGDGESNSNN